LVDLLGKILSSSLRFSTMPTRYSGKWRIRIWSSCRALDPPANATSHQLTQMLRLTTPRLRYAGIPNTRVRTDVAPTSYKITLLSFVRVVLFDAVLQRCSYTKRYTYRFWVYIWTLQVPFCIAQPLGFTPTNNTSPIRTPHGYGDKARTSPSTDIVLIDSRPHAHRNAGLRKVAHQDLVQLQSAGPPQATLSFSPNWPRRFALLLLTPGRLSTGHVGVRGKVPTADQRPYRESKTLDPAGFVA
jgi:hypothetical protein